MSKVVFSLFNTVGKSSYIPHSAQAETVWLALIEANKKSTNHSMFPSCPFLSEC